MRFTFSFLAALLAASASALPAQEAAVKVEKRCCTHTDQIECTMAAAINPACRNSPSCITQMEISCLQACGGVDC